MKKIFALSVAIAILLCGCSNGKDTPSETAPDVSSEEPAPYPFTVNDVEISQQPEAVVCLSPALAEIIFEIGYGDKIIGRSSYCDYPSEILSADDVGSTAKPDINAIIGLQPDLVITSTPIASKDIFTMEQAGIKTVIIPAPTTLEGFSSIYTSIGLIFEGMFTGTEAGENAYSQISKTLGNTGAVNIGNFIYLTEELAVAGGDTFESAVLSCFGTNIAKDASGYEYNSEELIENQPDIIILSDKYTEEDLLENEYFSQLNAVSEGRILFVDNVYFERPSGRLTEMVTQLLDDYNSLLRQESVDF